jgi:hypothetical protein
MNLNKMAILAIAVLFLGASVGGSALAQPKAAAPAQPSAAKGVKIMVVGKIVKDESMGGYYIQGKKPPEIFRIVNQNRKVLGNYAKSGKEVSIEAHSTLGDNLIIDKIQGKKYMAPKKQ